MIKIKFPNLWLILIIICLILLNNNIAFIESSEIDQDDTRSYKLLGWSQDIRISEDNDYYCLNTHVAVNGSYVHVLWDENLDSSGIAGHGLCYRRSSDYGNTWDDTVYLTSPYDSVSNDIAVSESYVHTVFTSHIPNTTGIKYRRSIDNGTTWEPINSNLTELSGTNLDISTYMNNVHVSFSYRDEKVEKIWRIIYLKSTDNGDTWTKPTYLVTGTGITNYLRPRLAVSGENIYIVYWGVNDTVELLKSHNNGDTWEHKLLFKGPNVHGPVIASNANHIGVVWNNKSNLSHPQLQFMKSDDYGKFWSKPVLINDQVETLYVSSKTPSMVVVNNIYYLVWEDYRDWRTESEEIYTEIYYKKGMNAGNNWTNDIRLTKKNPKGTSSRSPSISVIGNNIYVCWEDERVDDRNKIFFKRTLPDFIVDNLTVTSPEPLWANTSINMTLRLNNIGFADGYFINITVIYLDNIIFKGQIDKINLGEIEDLSFTWTPINSGSNTLEVIVDLEKNYQEWNEKNNGLTKTFSIQENSAPVSKFKVDKDKTKVFENITFDASDSYDPDGTIEAYYFNFGDGNNTGWINEPEIMYNYFQAGDYICSVKVQDNYGGINKNIVELEIKIEWWPLPPVINNVTTSPLNPFCNENVMILVDAIDLNLDSLEYIYNPENGSIIGTGANVTWQAPEMPGEYKINVHVSDGKFNSSTWTVKIWVYENQPPVIQNISYTSNEILPLESINITVNASDADGHSILYDFISSVGTLIQNGSNATWEAPDGDGVYIITINVSDAYGGYDQDKIFILVGEPKPDSLIKSFKTTPAKIYKDKETEILIELEIDREYTDFIDEVNINLSTLTGNPSEALLDSGINGDVARDDGIYSYRCYVKINNLTGEYRLWANVKTNILGFELNTSTVLEIEDKPGNDVNSLIGIYIGTTIVLILIIVIVLIVWIKKRKK